MLLHNSKVILYFKVLSFRGSHFLDVVDFYQKWVVNFKISNLYGILISSELQLVFIRNKDIHKKNIYHFYSLDEKGCLVFVKISFEINFPLSVSPECS